MELGNFVDGPKELKKQGDYTENCFVTIYYCGIISTNCLQFSAYLCTTPLILVTFKG
jgi:hypothetical protein